MKNTKKRLALGEKIMAAGFAIFFIFSSGLDGENWILPLIMAVVGLVITVIGYLIAKADGSGYMRRR